MEKTTNATTATAQGKKLSAVFALVLAVLLASTMALSARSAYAADMQAGTFSTTVPDTGDFIVMVQNPSDAAKVAFSGDELTIDGVNATVKTSGQTTQHIVVTNNATITLDGVDIAATGKHSAIKVSHDAKVNLILAEGSENKVVGGNDCAGVEVEWLAGDKFGDLTVDGKGSLDVTGGTGKGGGAGIGGSKSFKGVYGNITINGGTVIATGSGEGAGIGSSDNPANGASNGSYKYIEDAWGTITINGGDVTARGAGRAAGIGGGNHCDSGKIVIYGGTIHAYGHSGIGSGYGSHQTTSMTTLTKGPGYYYADITIYGGDIYAEAHSTPAGDTNDGGAGIGGGMYCDAKVVIEGGTIEAYGGNGKGINSFHHGAAGIGAGYEGHASVTISGDAVVKAYGGGAGAGIGSGPIANVNLANTKKTEAYKCRAGEVTQEFTDVTISGGTVYAEGGVSGGAGIGVGVGADKVRVTITGGEVVAKGGESNESAMRGGAGIGSGYSGTTSGESSVYFTLTDKLEIVITGGSVIATGGWGAAGIGSGADNTQAESITIDTENVTWLEAYADGTKFAIDTRVLNEDGSTTSADNTNITGDILQGTFVKTYTDDSGEHGTEGLGNISIIPEAASDVDGSHNEVLLTGMPDGYRSYAAKVAAPGEYTVYTDDVQLSEGHGRFFSKCATEQWAEDKVIGNNVKYTVESNKLSDNCYLFPVKAIIVDKVVLAGDVEGHEYDKDEFLKTINATFYFALMIDKDPETGTGDFATDSEGKMRIEAIDVVNGVAQNRAIFTGLQEGHTYDVWEVTEDGERMDPGIVNGFNLQKIRTAHGDDGTNNAVIGKIPVKKENGEDLTDEKGDTIYREIWSDYVTVKNTFVPTFDDESASEDPKDPEKSDDPTTPVVPSTDDPTKPTTTPTTPSTDPTTDPTTPATTPTTDPTAPATTEPTPADSSDTPTTPDDNSGTPTDDEGTPVNKTSRTSNVSTQNVPAPRTATPATAAPAAAAAPAAPAAPAAAPAAAAPAAPAAAAPATTAVADNGNPLASAEPDAESIDEDGNPLAGLFDLDCWVHWWILLGILATAVYSVVVIARRKKNSHTMKKLDKDVLNDDAENPSDSVAARPMNSPVVVA